MSISRKTRFPIFGTQAATVTTRPNGEITCISSSSIYSVRIYGYAQVDDDRCFILTGDFDELQDICKLDYVGHRVHADDCLPTEQRCRIAPRRTNGLLDITVSQ